MIKKHQVLDKELNFDDIKELEKKASLLRKVYYDYIKSMYDEVDITKIQDFKSYNWALERAFKDGMLSAYRKILELLKEE